jgi:hypothetical protein
MAEFWIVCLLLTLTILITAVIAGIITGLAKPIKEPLDNVPHPVDLDSLPSPAEWLRRHQYREGHRPFREVRLPYDFDLLRSEYDEQGR